MTHIICHRGSCKPPALAHAEGHARRRQLQAKFTTALPPRLLVHGVAGIGKSTFATSADKPFALPTEDGLGKTAAIPSIATLVPREKR
jgi:hypothetical protein